ncbi:MAG: glutamate--tRNA ligase [Paracoccaceae bacterium]|jgi:glutamyl-tRNA synthetase|nr:glutamate--tRNA ligase [Paracoccaceae bacterium]
MTDAVTDTTIVTRFAPSPTGFLHIGGARTALFNWLYARGRGGKFLLRIEDTDRARSTPEATEAIYDGLTWLGLDWDGDAISQFARVDQHRAAAEKMLETGGAYRCYATQEEIAAARDAAKAEGRPPRFDSPWRDNGPADWPDAPYTVRLKAPREGEIIVEDEVQGRVSFAATQIDDLIMLRSDGTPTYMLAVVVDDHEMGVTHVIRGDDHLTNAARQICIYNAMGWPIPSFAHIPLIHGPDGAKLSKRHGALGAEAYRDMGYLPEAMRNYLVRLGWAHGDDEFFSDAEMQKWFDLPQVGKSAARFDFKKLENLNGQHMRVADDAALTKAALALLQVQDGTIVSDAKQAMLTEAMGGLKERAKTLLDLLNSAHYILADRPFMPDEKATKLLSDDAKVLLSRLTSHLRNVNAWSSELLEEAVRVFAEAEDLKLGKVAQPMRAALTGRATSPGVFDVLFTLGREESLARLQDQSH